MEIPVCILLGVLGFQTIAGQGDQPPPPECIANMAQEPGFMECMGGFMTFMQNSGAASPGADAQGNEMLQIICSDEGQAAMACMLPFILQCPEISQQTGGLNLTALMSPESGGLEATCALLGGKCSAIQQCMTGSGMDSMGGDGDNAGAGGNAGMEMGGMEAPNAGMAMNPFVSFVQQATMACGPMKTQFDCLMSHLKECETQVREIENTLKSAVEMSMQGDQAITTYDQFKTFMAEECAKMPADLGTGGCVMRSLTNTPFLECYKTANDTYNMQQGEKCSLYELQSKCLDEGVGKDCGETHAAFLKSNMPLIVKNVPATCTDTSAAVRAVSIAASTILTLAVSLFFAL